MSTILDALQKVEEEWRASGHSPREQILFSPQVTPPPSSSRKGVWVIGLVFMSVGFAVGTGIALFRSGLTAPIPVSQPAPLVPAPTEQPSARPVSSIATVSRLPEAFSSPPAPVPQFPSEDLPELSPADPPLLADVRRPPSAVSKKHYRSEHQLYQQPQDTPDPQTLGPSSSLRIPNQDNNPSSRFPQSQRQHQSLKVSLNLLQWSPEAKKRRAIIRVNSGPMLAVHEGDTISDLKVERILPDRVELRFDDSTMLELHLGNPNFMVKPRTSSSSPEPLVP